MTENSFTKPIALFSEVDELLLFIEKQDSLKNLFFDLDGTLVNSEPLHVQAVIYSLCQWDGSVEISELMKLQEKGINSQLTGVNDHRVYEIIAENLGRSFNHSIEELIAIKSEFLTSDEVNALLKSPQCFKPQIKNILTELKQRGMRLGIVSASQRKFVDHVIETLSLEKLFDFSVAREDTPETKPLPEPYLYALKSHNLIKEETLILEDSETGLKAARDSLIPFSQVSWYS